MRCAQCGTENQEGATYCASCGAALVVVAVTSETAAPATSSTPVGAAAVGASGDPGPAPAQSPPPVAPSGQPHGSGPSTDEMKAGLQHATDRLEAAAAPYEQRLGPIQDMLTPLEGLGKQVVTWIGAAFIIIGLFLPIKTYSASVSIVSVSVSWNYWSVNSLLATLFLIAALAAAGLAYLRMYVWNWLIGAFLFIFFLFGFINSFSGESGVGAHPSWGWIVLLIGLLGLLAGTAMRDTGRKFQL
jgi:zinc-ribbon domain